MPLSAAEAHSQLQDKRLARPNSPWHIYKPQLTSVTSLANRGTGVFLSAGKPTNLDSIPAGRPLVWGRLLARLMLGCGFGAS